MNMVPRPPASETDALPLRQHRVYYMTYSIVYNILYTDTILISKPLSNCYDITLYISLFSKQKLISINELSIVDLASRGGLAY